MNYQRKKSQVQMSSPKKTLDPNQLLLKKIPTSNLQSKQYQIDSQALNLNVYRGQQKYCIASFLNCCGTTLICIRFFLPCIWCCTKSPFYHQSSSTFGILQNFGRFSKVLNPGFNIINPLTENVIQVSRQTKILQVRQSLLTKDNISIQIQTIIYYRIYDPLRLAYGLGNIYVDQSVRQLAYSAVRSVGGKNIFQSLLSNRQSISLQLKTHINEIINIWGIYIQQMFFKDLILQKQLQDDLSLVAKTLRYQQANIINAKALVQTANYFRQASQSLNTKAAYQMRYLNLISQISETNNQKIMMINMYEKYDQK